MSYHDCRAMLCETPHSPNDDHSDSCLCELCHPEHDWETWTIYPLCKGCRDSLAQWIHENTDFDGCPIPEDCTYRHEFLKPRAATGRSPR